MMYDRDEPYVLHLKEQDIIRMHADMEGSQLSSRRCVRKTGTHIFLRRPLWGCHLAAGKR